MRGINAPETPEDLRALVPVDGAALGDLALADGAALVAGAARDLVRADAAALRVLVHEAGPAAMISARVNRTTEALDGAATLVRIRMPVEAVMIDVRVVMPISVSILVEAVMIGVDRKPAEVVMTGAARIGMPVEVVMIDVDRVVRRIEVAMIGVLLPQGRTRGAVQRVASAATIDDVTIAGAGMTGVVVADLT
jgi:hypothetical protein